MLAFSTGVPGALTPEEGEDRFSWSRDLPFNHESLCIKGICFSVGDPESHKVRLLAPILFDHVDKH